nr:MAG TPA: portal protein [Caudoviricetes sp.]
MVNNPLGSWNAFMSTNNGIDYDESLVSGSGWGRPANALRGYSFRRQDLVNSIISMIALDVAMVDFKHLKIDDEDGNQTPVKSGLIDCLTLSANIDQTGRAFIYDVAWSLLEEGTVAIVPVDTTSKPNDEGSYDILSMRVGKIIQWYPRAVRVRVYNDQNGLEQDLTLSKRSIVILESPLTGLLKDQNSTLRLLEQKMDLMYSQDKAIAAGKLNGFIQVPYATKSSMRQERAKQRKSQLEAELADSQFGIATLDANEKFIHTGGNITNNLVDDIRKLQQDYYNQVGISSKILDGTAGQAELNLYYHRAVDPVLQTIVDGLSRIFLTKTARSQGQVIQYYRDPFRMLPVEQLGIAADLFARNAIFTSNEIRAMLGRAPHPSMIADMLFNKNISDGTDLLGSGGYSNNGTTQREIEENTIYDDGKGGYTDLYGNPVDENGRPLDV